MAPPTPVAWTDLDVAEIDVATLYDVLALRVAVFVVEQACAYQEVDGLDLAEGTRHVVGRWDAQVVAYARVLAPGPEHPTPRIGRVLVAGSSRGHRLSRELMGRALDSSARHWPGQAVELGAQAHLTRFYTSLGFRPVGAVYDEDGIPHQWMRRESTLT